MQIPLIDLRPQYRALKPELDAAIQRVVDRGQFILGEEVEALERELAAFCGIAHAVGVASGTDALTLALRACGVGPRDEVLTTAFSFIAPAEAILAVGATPVFVDIDPATYAMDPAAAAARISPRTKALLPVHLYGHPADLDALVRLARARGLALIEDCAQAIAARYRGRPVGGFGDAAALSFFPSKNLGAYGDGGMVLTNHGKIADRVRLLRAHGSRQRYQHETLGVNSRLDELQAAILRVKLRHLDAWTAARRAHARRYAEALARLGLGGLVLPQEQPGCTHVYHLYTIRLQARERIQQRLAERDIATQVAYPTTLPAQPPLRAWAAPEGYPVAEAAAREVLSLPMYAELAAEQMDRIVHELAQVAPAAA